PAVAVLAPDFIIFVQFITLLQSTLSSYDIFSLIQAPIAKSRCIFQSLLFLVEVLFLTEPKSGFFARLRGESEGYVQRGTCTRFCLSNKDAPEKG
ncbi:hypothetical protein COCCADRAFT_110210, partial [Bipolaris zeicola 26-R-13]